MKIKIFVGTGKKDVEDQCNDYMLECVKRQESIIDVRFTTDIVNMEGWYSVLIMYE